jgi:aspartyl/asparaginyl beta-hydroxylase (cupin superfamily)
VNTRASPSEIEALESEAAKAAQAGRGKEALRLWGRILQIDPNHVRTLAAVGQQAFNEGDPKSARATFQRLTAVDPGNPQHWVQLALACRQLNDDAGAEIAIQRALNLDPMELVALILRGNLLERQGRKHDAARAYGAVAAVAPPLERLHPSLRPAVTHAWTFREQYDRECAAFLDERLEAHFKTFAGEKLDRFRDSLDIMVGRKRRYDSRSAVYHYPQLAPTEFFARADFPWLDRIEAATDAIRDEFLQVLATEEGFMPYITYPQDVPHNQWAELNNSPRWSAFHLYKMGQAVAGNAVRCPATVKVLEAAPMPDQPGRTPAAMFSLLKAKTRIPPHNGVTNTRLVTHLALIVPEGCGFRCGNETRSWVPGKAWVFDDTIEHEAWNDSDKLRVVLIFDIWHPHLTPAERAMITALMAGLNEFAGASAAFDP